MGSGQDVTDPRLAIRKPADCVGRSLAPLPVPTHHDARLGYAGRHGTAALVAESRPTASAGVLRLPSPFPRIKMRGLGSDDGGEDHPVITVTGALVGPQLQR